MSPFKFKVCRHFESLTLLLGPGFFLGQPILSHFAEVTCTRYLLRLSPNGLDALVRAPAKRGFAFGVNGHVSPKAEYDAEGRRLGRLTGAGGEGGEGGGSPNKPALFEAYWLPPGSQKDTTRFWQPMSARKVATFFGTFRSVACQKKRFISKLCSRAWAVQATWSGTASTK